MRTTEWTRDGRGGAFRRARQPAGRRRWPAAVVGAVLLALGLDPTLGHAELILSYAPIADTFVRGSDPDLNYGAAGALSVSGVASVNGSSVAMGVADSLLRFDVSSLVAAADLAYGTGAWHLVTATLSLTEVASPNNAIFNRGTGGFDLYWLEDDAWVEGTGNPSVPSTAGLDYTEAAGLRNAAVDRWLGAYTNAGSNGRVDYSLALDASFLSDVEAGGMVTLFATAIDASIGYTFNSRNNSDAASRPALALVIVPEPGSAVMMLAGAVTAWGWRRWRRT